MIKSFKNKVAGLIAGPKKTLYQITASDATISETETKKRTEDTLRHENSRLKDLLAEQKAALEFCDKRFNEINKANRVVIKLLFKAGTPYEEIYNLVAPGIDADGKKRLVAAKRLIPEDIISIYSCEESEKPEDRDSDEQLYWLELAKFGKCSSSNHCLDIHGSSYVEYRKRLHRRVLEEMLAESQFATHRSVHPCDEVQ